MSADSITNAPAGRRSRLPMLALAALLGGVFFFRLGQDLPLRTHEALVAETARNMLLGRPATLDDGSQPSPWLVPNFNGVARLQKTPIEYWLVAGLSSLTGRVDEWTARLPSAAAAAGTVLIVVALVWRRGRRPAALLAGAMLATTAGFLIMARSALADMTMTFFCTASLATLWMAVETTGRRRFAWLILAGAAAGLAMLAKGPAPALVLPVPYAAAAGIIIARLIRQRRITTPLSPGGRGAGGEGAVSTPLSPRGRGAGGEGADLGWTIAGTLAASAVFLAIALPWPLAVYAQVPDALRIWKAESVDRSTGDFGHEEPIYFYVIRLPVLLLPWTVFFVYGVVVAIRRWREEPSARAWLLFLGAWLAGPLLAFSLAAGKQDHYILPIIPAAALYSAIAVGHLFGSSAPKVQRAARRLIIGHAVLIGLALLVPLMWGPRGAAYVRAPLLWTTILLAAFLGPLAAYVLARLGRPSTGMVSLITSIALAFFFAWVALIGPSGPASSAADFGRRLSWAVPKEAELYAYPSANTTIAITVFYAGRPVPPLPRAAETRAAIAASRTLYVVCRDRDLKALEGVAHFVRLWRVPSEANDFWLMTSAAAVPQP